MKQIKIKIRMIALLAVVLMSSSVALAQTSTSKHIVERGETLESIAEKYGVSKDDLVKLNPDAGQFVYVGMELIVPEGDNKATTNNKYVASPSQQAKVQEEAISYQESNSPIEPSFKISLGFLRFGDDFKVRSSSFTYTATAGINYKFQENWYMSANIGWKHYNINTTEKGSKSSGVNLDCVVLPLSCGYSFNDGNWLAISPYIGMEFAYALKGKAELEGETTSKKVKDVTNSRFAATVSIGLNLCKYVSVAYNYELTEMCGEKAHSRYFSVGIGMLF